jgi:hypothetical protein
VELFLPDLPDLRRTVLLLLVGAMSLHVAKPADMVLDRNVTKRQSAFFGADCGPNCGKSLRSDHGSVAVGGLAP